MEMVSLQKDSMLSNKLNSMADTSNSHQTTVTGRSHRRHERPTFVKAMSLKLTRSSSTPNPRDAETLSEDINNRFPFAASNETEVSHANREEKCHLSKIEGGDGGVQRQRRSLNFTTGRADNHHPLISSKSFRHASKSLRVLLSPSDLSKSESVLDTPVTSIWDGRDSGIMALTRQMQTDMNLHTEDFGRVFLHSKSSSMGPYFSQKDAMAWLLDKVSSTETSFILDENLTSQKHHTSSFREESNDVTSPTNETREKAAELGNRMLDAGCIATKCRHRFGIDEEDPMLRFDGAREPSPSVLYEFCHIILRAASILTEEHSLEESQEVPRRNLSSRATDLVKDFSIKKLSVIKKDSNTPESEKIVPRDNEEHRHEIDPGLLCLVRQLQTDFQCLKIMKDRTWHLHWHRKTFLREEVVDWIARQIQIQHGFWRMEQRSDKKTPDPVLTSSEAEYVAISIGSAMAKHGYIFFCGHKNDSGTGMDFSLQASTDTSKVPPLKFNTERILSDVQQSNLSSSLEKEVDCLVNKLVHEEIQKTNLGKSTKSFADDE